MIILKHRINTVAELIDVPARFGAELDVRYHNDDLILQHDPFSHHLGNADRFEDFLKAWKHEGPLFVNLKTEGIEDRCIELLVKNKVPDWVFLDMSMPYFVKYSRLAIESRISGFGPGNLAVRFSEHEPIEYALSFSGGADWVWVDCFSKLPMTQQVYETLKSAGFKICLVSPELQGHPTTMIPKFRSALHEMPLEAVCTKFPELWETA